MCKASSNIFPESSTNPAYIQILCHITGQAALGSSEGTFPATVYPRTHRTGEEGSRGGKIPLPLVPNRTVSFTF
ncbi:hypothetical protein PCASD_03944 [Puccinia coronata f. sp. avenae]|uniref:Uncharacterized protein n=1 Tax=Puccinia coronata f. sp. avenae TaxID=200324 RepID=A0A2N5VAI3_9BASI|nr:hypothetical protein PCASD_23874 [Puccinia coronata f. sp. avenae]PLW47019.1 hypothetical protein PCASD_03944 [Puccinia coronata f. sp. avenae]